MVEAQSNHSPLLKEDQAYGEEYYQHGCGPIPYERNSHWLNFFGTIASEIIRSLRPKRVLDAGCAWGFLVESFWDNAVEAHGVDVSSYGIRNVRPDIRPYCNAASLTEPVAGHYDLVTCIEVLEHMPEREAEQAIQNLTGVTDAILFSSTPNDFQEPTHVNVRPPIYWLQLFAKYNFAPELNYDASFISPHAFLLRRAAESLPLEVLQLFNEMLRTRIFRVAFLTRQTRIEELEKAQGENRAEIEKLRLSESDYKREVSELESQVRNYLNTANENTLQIAAYETDISRQIAEQAKVIEERNAASALVNSLQVELERVRLSLSAAEKYVEVMKCDRELLQSGFNDAEIARQKIQTSLTVAVGTMQALKRENSLLQGQLNDSGANLSKQTAQYSSLVHERDESLGKENALTAEVARLRAELSDIHASPGWRAIQAYRLWLQENYSQRTWVRHYLDPSMRWMLRKKNLWSDSTEPAAASAISPAASSAVSATVIDDKSKPLETNSQEAPQQAPTDPADYLGWISENEPSASRLLVDCRIGSGFSYRPKISVLTPIYRVPQSILQETIESVQSQSYQNWELCLAHADPGNVEQRAWLSEIASSDSRIHLRLLDQNYGIAENSNQAFALVTGEFVALLDHDDTLAPFALFEIVTLLNRDASANFIYSDKDQITENSDRRDNPLFKPQWSPEVMLSANYLTHLCVMRSEHIRAIGGWRKETDGAQDWDLFLRVIAAYGNVRFIPKVLYHWRRIATSVASGGLSAKPYAAAGQVFAARDYCRKLGLPVEVSYPGGEALRVKWIPWTKCKVSLIYLSESDHPPGVQAKIQKVLSRTDFPDLEVLIPSAAEKSVDHPLRHVPISPDATLIDKIQAAVAMSSGDVLVFIDEFVTPIDADWLSELIAPLQQQDIAVTGAKLIDPQTGLIRHCGLIFSSEGEVESIYAGYPEHVNEQFGPACWYRNWSAVSGACFAMRREVWSESGGVSNGLLHSRLDVHLCLSAGFRLAKRILYNPYVRMHQAQLAAIEQSKWNDSAQASESIRTHFPDGDPYFNPNLVCREGRITFKRQRQSGVADRQVTDYAAESRILTQVFDFSRTLIDQSNELCGLPGNGQFETITWFIPGIENAFYGGIHTILRFAEGFRKNHGVRSLFCIIGDGPPSRYRTVVAAAFPELAAKSEFAVHTHTEVNRLPPSDASVCTLWTTAYANLYFTKTKRKFYFIQDDEALFYPAGSSSALVEATYGFGFNGLCNTEPLLDRYRQRGGDGEFFTPNIDPSIFHANGREQSKSGALPYLLFCYGRPGHARNCFELLCAILAELKKRFGDEILIVNAGAPWNLGAYGLDNVVENLGMLDYRTTGALYRTCDAGVVMMMTRHPSYLPFELAACGSLVITNRNPDTAWLLKDGVNCLLADPGVTTFTDRIEQGLRDLPLRQQMTERAQELIESGYSDWDTQIEKIYRYVLSRF